MPNIPDLDNISSDTPGYFWPGQGLNLGLEVELLALLSGAWLPEEGWLDAILVGGVLVLHG